MIEPNKGALPNNINDVLSQIQIELNAPKNLFNAFGKYYYRNCEGILEGVKPMLTKYGGNVRLSDDIVEIFGRIYVKATASYNLGDQTIAVSALAREELDKKGMDAAQITGSTSSYARKYALNGLFAIDDTKDPDTMDNKSVLSGLDKISEVLLQIESATSKDELTKLWQTLSPSIRDDKKVYEAFANKKFNQ